MKILVDGDACPVKDIIIAAAMEYHVKVLYIHSTSHVFKAPECGLVEGIMVDNESQAADMAIINRVLPGDLVITGDFGLASLVLPKNACALSFDGKLYDEENIDRLLFERHVSAVIRKGGGRVRGPAKRSREDDCRFESALKSVILKNLKDI